MTFLTKIAAGAALAASIGAFAGFAGPALAVPASGAASLAADHLAVGATLPVEHVQYYGYGYPGYYGYAPYYDGYYGPACFAERRFDYYGRPYRVRVCR